MAHFYSCINAKPSKGLAIVCSFPRSLLSLLVTDDMIYIDCWLLTPDKCRANIAECEYSNWQQMVPSPHKITANHQNTETPEMWCICSQYHITITKFPQNRYAMHVHTNRQSYWDELHPFKVRCSMFRNPFLSDKQTPKCRRFSARHGEAAAVGAVMEMFQGSRSWMELT